MLNVWIIFPTSIFPWELTEENQYDYFIIDSALLLELEKIFILLIT